MTHPITSDSTSAPEPNLDPEEAALVAEISDDCFGGDPVPPDLAALWLAQERGDTELLDSFELVLLSGIDPTEVMAPFADDPESDPVAVAALGRFLGEVVLVAEALDATLLGYWTPPLDASVPADGSDRAVVISCDGAGQVAVQGSSMGEALVALTDPDDPDEAAEVVAQLARLGIEVSARTVDAVLESIDGVPDPNEVILGYVLEARLSEPNT